MIYKASPLVAILGSGLMILTAQQPVTSSVTAGVFTAAQAEAGRLAYERT